MMRVVFMGTGEIALPTFHWLLEAEEGPGEGRLLVGAFTQPDKPAGRGQFLTAPEVKKVAQAAGVPVFQPDSFRRDAAAVESLRALRPDLVVVMAYGQILPQEVIETPSIACLNLHASLLPRHRGASPVQAAIREGDAESGVSLMHVDRKLDSGPVLLREAFPLAPDETGGSLHDRLAEVAPVALARGIAMLREGPAPGEPQDEALATYSGKLGREDGRLDWGLSAEVLERLLRAYDPWPGTHAEALIEGEARKVKLFPPAQLVEGGFGEPGRAWLEGGRLFVACGNGALRLEGSLQFEGRKRLSAEEWLRGLGGRIDGLRFV